MDAIELPTIKPTRCSYFSNGEAEPEPLRLFSENKQLVGVQPLKCKFHLCLVAEPFAKHPCLDCEHGEFMSRLHSGRREPLQCEDSHRLALWWQFGALEAGLSP